MSEYTIEEIKEYADKIRERNGVDKVNAMMRQLIDEVERHRADKLAVYRLYVQYSKVPVMTTTDLDKLGVAMEQHGVAPGYIHGLYEQYLSGHGRQLLRSVPGMPSGLSVTKNLELDPGAPPSAHRVRGNRDTVYVADLQDRVIRKYPSTKQAAYVLGVSTVSINHAIRTGRRVRQQRYVVTDNKEAAELLLGSCVIPEVRPSRKVVRILVKKRTHRVVLHTFRSTREFADFFSLHLATARNAVSFNDGAEYTKVPNHPDHVFLVEFLT